jgi:hypothetical protein
VRVHRKQQMILIIFFLRANEHLCPSFLEKKPVLNGRKVFEIYHETVTRTFVTAETLSKTGSSIKLLCLQFLILKILKRIANMVQYIEWMSLFCGSWVQFKRMWTTTVGIVNRICESMDIGIHWHAEMKFKIVPGTLTHPPIHQKYKISLIFYRFEHSDGSTHSYYCTSHHWNIYSTSYSPINSLNAPKSCLVRNWFLVSLLKFLGCSVHASTKCP